MSEILTYTAFKEFELLSHGPLEEVVLDVRKCMKHAPASRVLVFNDATGKQMDFDVSGTEQNVVDRLKIYVSPEGESAPGARGRPKLGVIAREVSLLPRHWEWLSTQSGGASATLRRLVDEAKKRSFAQDSVRQIQERTYKFMSAIAGDLPNYEEAIRALYQRDKKTFQKQMSGWAPDVRAHALRMSERLFEG